MPSTDCYCPACRSIVDDFIAGGAAKVRARAVCPKCRSLERHRLLALVLETMAPVLAAARVVLDVAPSPQLTPLLQRECGGLYLPCDLDPAADRRSVALQCDLTALPLPDDSVDVIMCIQVLEHVPDDLAAMRELRRVLAPGGVALVSVPYRKGTITDEDPGAPPDERTRRFGQADHVRFYGDDFDERLTAAGLRFAKVTSLELCGAEVVHRLGLSPGEHFWFVRATGDGDAPGVPGMSTLGAFAAMMAARREPLPSSVARVGRASMSRLAIRVRAAAQRVPGLKGAVRRVRRLASRRHSPQ